MQLDQNFWENRYKDNLTGWDIGGVSPQLQDYFQRLAEKDLKILIPGCGNGHEAIWLAQNGFKDITVIDLAAAPLAHVKNKAPSIKAIQGNFFQLEEKFDLVIEQTFFCALNPIFRQQYVDKMANLLKPKGKIAGLLFSVVFDREGPPFGGNTTEYRNLFEEQFEIITLEPALLSIKPRLGREVFFEFRKK